MFRKVKERVDADDGKQGKSKRLNEIQNIHRDVEINDLYYGVF